MTKNRTHAVIAMALIGAAAVLHGLEHSLFDPVSSAQLFFLWAMAPYVVCLVILVLSAKAIPVISAAAVALALDIYTHYAVETSESSTAVLAYLWMPIWNTVIFVPGSIGAALLVLKWRARQSHAL